MSNTTHTQAGTLSHYNKVGNRILNHWRIQDAKRGIDIAQISLDVPIDERERTAADIVRCVNSHDAMLNALKDLLGDVGDLCDGSVSELQCHWCGRDYEDLPSGSLCTADDCPGYRARAAIAQAEGKI